jgi:3-deoxy-D-manno-octulosonic-acid transferase
MRLIGPAWALAATAAAPGLRLMLKRRAGRGREVAARLPERFGIDPTPRPPGRLLWLHAASVGETLSALPLVAALPPRITTLFTTGTVTSAAMLVQRVAELGLTDRVLHRFVPLDVPAWGARFLDHWQPDAACFVESELWPNLLAACRRRRIPMALVNARLSARSAAAWARAPGFAREVLAGFAWIEAQSPADAARLRALGAAPVAASGNLKYAGPVLPADATAVESLAKLLGDRPRWLAASTHIADDAVVAATHLALSRRHPGLLTCIAPRHPQRGAALAQAFSAPRRALGQAPPAGPGIWVADTLGELGLLFRAIPIVFMGKSFAGGGGQNPIEPARLGCAVATGPDTQNFADAIFGLRQAGAVQVVQNEAGLIAWVDAMLRDPAARRAMGEAAIRATTQAGDLPALLAERLAALMERRLAPA